MKNLWKRLKVAGAVLLSTALLAARHSVIAEPQSAQAAAGAFTCTSDFYQVASGKMYQYSVASNTYSLMASGTTISGLNGIGYNTGDNYIYGVGTGSTLYKVANDGSSVASSAVTGVAPQNTGGDFIAANQLLTTGGGAWTLINVTTKVATAFTATGTSWAAFDLAYNPTNTTVYGMDGTTLYIGKVTGTSSIAITTKPTSGSAAATTDRWGAAYVDSAGNVYFFDNTTFKLVEISAANLANATPAAIAVTQANSLVAPNDGASCPTASSPLAPTVVTTAATAVTTTTATLNGTVATGIPTGSDVPSNGIEICYSTSSTVVSGALSVSPVCAVTTPGSLAINTSATAVTLPVTGLSSGTTYYFQIQATNSTGLQAFGNVLNFTTVAATHTVTFNNNGGTGSMANEVNNAATALTTNTFTRAGYTFSGWNTAANGSGTAYADAASYPFTADVTLYAQWTALPTHTVIFNNNGGTGSMANEVNNVATALTTNTFTRAGYTFSGWNTAANGSGTAYADSASYPFTADVTLYAQWTALPTHTVIFDNNGGTGSMANEVNNVAAALTTNTFTRAGFSFSGWNTAANGSGTAYANSASYPFTADVTLYAQWTALPSHTVIFDNNGGTGVMANEVNNVATALTTDTFTRAGYSFSGWNTAANGSGTAYADGASYPFTADVTLYAQWTALPNHTVIFNNNGGTGVMANEVNNVATALTTDTFTRAGYSFSGWNTAANGSGTAYADGASYPFTADVTLYAQWTALPNHTVIFNNNGGAGSIANEVQNVATALTTNTFTRAGYSFSGWNTAANGSGTAYADAASYPFTADATLYAQWTALPNHTVTFDNNGGTGSMANEVNNVATALTSNTFTRAGFTYSGWNTAANGSGTAYADAASYPFTADVTLYAQWTPIGAKTVMFDSNGGTGSMANEATNVPTPLTGNAFTRAGYTFAGWNTAANGSGTAYADTASYSFATDATMYAQWTAVPTKTVTFNNNGGTGSMADEVTNVPTPLTSNAFTRSGYTFSGWNTAANGSGTSYADAASYPFTADATMYAQWTPLPSHTVTFDNNGGTGSMADEVHNVATALTADAFTRFGYTFSGWNTAANGSGTAYADTASYPFTADATMYAQWTALPNHTVVFDNNGGTGSMADEVDNVPTPLTNNSFTRPGFTFSGWNTAANGTGTAYADAASYPFAGDATLFAQWTAVPTKTVTFNSNGGSGSIADEVNNVPAALTSNAFTRVGYTFVGWNTAANGSGTSYADTATFSFGVDATMFAQWSALPVLTFDVNGGTGTVDAITGSGVVHLPMTTVPRPGFTFVGWNTMPDGSGTEYGLGDLYTLALNDVLYAQFTRNSLAATGVEIEAPLAVAGWFILIGFAMVIAVAAVRRRRATPAIH